MPLVYGDRTALMRHKSSGDVVTRSLGPMRATEPVIAHVDWLLGPRVLNEHLGGERTDGPHQRQTHHAAEGHCDVSVDQCTYRIARILSHSPDPCYHHAGCKLTTLWLAAANHRVNLSVRERVKIEPSLSRGRIEAYIRGVLLSHSVERCIWVVPHVLPPREVFSVAPSTPSPQLLI